MPSPLRSFLFAPGNRPRMLQKGGTVRRRRRHSWTSKTRCRSAKRKPPGKPVHEAVGAIDTCPVYVRINPLVATAGFSQPIGEADLAAIIRPGLAGVILPKVESPDDLRRADTLLHGTGSATRPRARQR